jgi:hypothetical protein
MRYRMQGFRYRYKGRQGSTVRIAHLWLPGLRPLYGHLPCRGNHHIRPVPAPDDLYALPDREKAADFEQFSTLLRRRRSIREFKDRLSKMMLSPAYWTRPAPLHGAASF